MYFEAINLLFEAEEVAAESSLFSPDQFAGYAVTALLTAVNVLVAYIVIKKFIFKPIVKMIHNREEALNGELDAAAKSKEEAEGIVETLKKCPYSADAAIIGEVTAEEPGRVIMETEIGTQALLPQSWVSLPSLTSSTIMRKIKIFRPKNAR